MFAKFWNALCAQFNKLGDSFRRADPVAEMRLEYERGLARLRRAREGLASYRAVADQLALRAERDAHALENLDTRVDALLAAGDRPAAATAAVEADELRRRLEAARIETAGHEERYAAQLDALRDAAAQLKKTREDIRRYDAELRMGDAEAEAFKLMQGLDTDFTGDFAQIAEVIEDKLARRRAHARVAVDVAGDPTPKQRREERAALGEELLRRREAARALAVVQPA